MLKYLAVMLMGGVGLHPRPPTNTGTPSGGVGLQDKVIHN